MKKPILAIAVSTCFGQSVLAGEAEFSIDLISSSQVRIENVSIEYDGGSPVLMGKVKRRLYNSRVLPGHVDYVVRGGAGKVVVEGATQYSPSLSLRRWKYGSSFAIALPKGLSGETIVQIGFHRDAYHSPPNSPVAPHTENKLL